MYTVALRDFPSEYPNDSQSKTSTVKVVLYHQPQGSSSRTVNRRYLPPEPTEFEPSTRVTGQQYRDLNDKTRTLALKHHFSHPDVINCRTHYMIDKHSLYTLGHCSWKEFFYPLKLEVVCSSDPIKGTVRIKRSRN